MDYFVVGFMLCVEDSVVVEGYVFGFDVLGDVVIGWGDFYIIELCIFIVIVMIG